MVKKLFWITVAIMVVVLAVGAIFGLKASNGGVIVQAATGLRPSSGAVEIQLTYLSTYDFLFYDLSKYEVTYASPRLWGAAIPDDLFLGQAVVTPIAVSPQLRDIVIYFGTAIGALAIILGVLWDEWHGRSLKNDIRRLYAKVLQGKAQGTRRRRSSA